MSKFFISLFLSFILLASPAFAEIDFQTSADKELYTNFVRSISERKVKNFRDRVDFQNVIADTSSFNKTFSKRAILYVDEDQLQEPLVQSPNGFYGSLRIATVYTGLGLANVGYQAYSQNFNNLKVAFLKQPKDCLIIKPEILSVNWLMEERGLFISDMYLFANLVVQITIIDGDKVLLQKNYKMNNVTISIKELRKSKQLQSIGASSDVIAIVVAKALTLAFQKNILDLSEIIN